MINRVEDIPEDFDLIDIDFVVEYYKDYLGVTDESINGLLVKVEDGDVVEAYGYHGVVPYLKKTVYRLC